MAVISSAGLEKKNPYHVPDFRGIPYSISPISMLVKAFLKCLYQFNNS